MKPSWIVGIVIGGLSALATLVLHAANNALSPFSLIDAGLNFGIWFGLSILVGFIITKVRNKSSNRTMAPVVAVPAQAPTYPAAPQQTSPGPQGESTRQLVPGWYPDPFGRFTFRYWDSRWTDHVSTQGRVYEDPAN